MSKINQQERKDFEKFTKFLIYKSIQVIVQSRLGEKIKTSSKPFSTGADWVNKNLSLYHNYGILLLPSEIYTI